MMMMIASNVRLRLDLPRRNISVLQGASLDCLDCSGDMIVMSPPTNNKRNFVTQVVARSRNVRSLDLMLVW